MGKLIKCIKNILISCCFIILTNCSTVPKEVVELSYVAGEDIESLYSSYDTLIHQYYETLRSQRRQYLDDIWYPRFLENWRDTGKLVAIAKGDVIWSEPANGLVDTPPNTDPKESLNTLNDWVTFALYAYEVKELSLIKPLDNQEEQIRTDVRKAFDNLMRANATITAHLNSITEVKQAQNQALDSFDIKELRDKINGALIKASEQANTQLENIREKDEQLTDFVGQVDKLTGTQ